MHILDELNRDHARLRQEMDELQQDPPNGESRERLARFVGALIAHAHLEDELLFAALEPYLPAEHGPLQVMRGEHDEIEARLARLAGADPARAETRPDLARLFELARHHFLREERVLFPFASRLLDGPRLAVLGEAYRAATPAALTAFATL